MLAGCGCDFYGSQVELSGQGYLALEPDEAFGLKLEERSDTYNELFLDAEANTTQLHYFSIPRPDMDITDFSFTIDFTEPVGTIVTGPGDGFGGCCLGTIEKSTVQLRTNVRGGLTIDGRRLTFTAIQATILDKSPPTADLVFRGPDETGEDWVVELRLESGRAGNAPTCD